MEKKIGHYSFIGGVIIAIVLGVASDSLGTATVWLSSLLVVLGLVAGYLNVVGKETKDFLLTATILVIISNMASGTLGALTFGGIGAYLEGIFGNMRFLSILVITFGSIRMTNRDAETSKILALTLLLGSILSLMFLKLQLLSELYVLAVFVLTMVFTVMLYLTKQKGVG